MIAKTIASASAAFFALAGAALAQPADDSAQGRPGGGVRQACQADIARLCGDVEHGGGRIRQCLMSHSDQVSDGCKSAIAQARQWRHDHAQGGGGAPQGSPPQN